MTNSIKYFVQWNIENLGSEQSLIHGRILGLVFLSIEDNRNKWVHLVLAQIAMPAVTVQGQEE